MTVLVVDDDPGIRDLLTELLEDEGHNVVSAANGLEAINQLQRSTQQPCLILLDLMMPVMNGWQFRNEQKQDPTLASIPVVVLSARTDIQQQSVVLDATAHIAKPINVIALLDMVNRYCAGDRC
jgi:CheY-like chemotaxis protein